MINLGSEWDQEKNNTDLSGSYRCPTTIFVFACSWNLVWSGYTCNSWSQTPTKYRWFVPWTVRIAPRIAWTNRWYKLDIQRSHGYKVSFKTWCSDCSNHHLELEQHTWALNHTPNSLRPQPNLNWISKPAWRLHNFSHVFDLCLFQVCQKLSLDWSN